MQEIIDFDSGSQEGKNVSPRTALERFCHDVGRELQTQPLCGVPRRVADLLPNLLLQPDLLSPAQRRAPTDSYGRNRVFICPHNKFSVLAMVWPAGVTTPIHDHREWCTLGVYEGLIEESYYSPATEAANCTTAVLSKTVCHRPGAIAHMPMDAPNIHSIHNPTGKDAISIHVYGGNCETLGPNLDKIYTVG